MYRGDLVLVPSFATLILRTFYDKNMCLYLIKPHLLRFSIPFFFSLIPLSLYKCLLK